MESNVATAPTTFRDRVPNADANGGRRWLYPRLVAGRLYRWRTGLAWVLLAALFAGPFVWVDGHPLFLFNVLERRFIFFGVTFWPQDFHLVAIGLLTFITFVALFTVVYGRVWCGWACPQTIFMEMIFRRVERLIEGDHNARRRLDAGPWTTEKVVKKTAKHSVFFLLSFVISNTFLAYLIGRDQWLTLVTDDPARHLGGLAAILVFTGVFYLVFARLREIVCTTICPYGRLQGVLLDKNSLIVAYDYVRGEPRGKRQGVRGVGQGAGVLCARGVGQGARGKTCEVNLVPHALSPLPHAPRFTPQTLRPLPPARSTPAPHGDCVDCKLCVQVCPMGIDIRNGSQLECINCTACMDACDDVMIKLNRPRGLIRIDSLAGIEHRQPVRFNGRMAAYSAVLAGLVGVLVFLLVSRAAVEVTVLRAPGQLFQREANHQVSNLYLIELVNKTNQTQPIRFRLSHPEATIRFVQPIREVPANELTKGTFFILLPEKTIRQNSTPIELEVLSGDEVLDNVKTSFLGPVSMSERVNE
ncbi:4Fe-4S binding protein [Fibrisoma montanum]|uniref:4Fe-4S binding protein n=1 Tax=Fibrisoma montanum TaxID=2305895 RepID=A0A418LWW6_9BACT|nr:4Fe-4S dicluster domain-containing protein [Fibrisoma montanum]RIV17721.1 4Fe-4S binding protein [Fibrisoma montanum]